MTIELPEEMLREAVQESVQAAVRLWMQNQQTSSIRSTLDTCMMIAHATLRVEIEAMVASPHFAAEYREATRAALLEATRERAKSFVAKMPDKKLYGVLTEAQ